MAYSCEYHEVQRRSQNRAHGVMITRPVKCDRDKYRELMIEKVLPAIKEKWPDRERKILIQQDGAPAHIFANDVEFGRHARAGNWNIRIETQPAKSPDTNVLDLSFFCALQSHQWKSPRQNSIDGLIQQVLQSFRNFEPRKIDFGFLTLQPVLDDILCCHGDNDFKIAHIGKERLLQNGELPTRIEASEEAAAVARFVRDTQRRQRMDDNNNNGDNGLQEQVQMIQQHDAV